MGVGGTGIRRLVVVLVEGTSETVEVWEDAA